MSANKKTKQKWLLIWHYAISVAAILMLGCLSGELFSRADHEQQAAAMICKSGPVFLNSDTLCIPLIAPKNDLENDLSGLCNLLEDIVPKPTENKDICFGLTLPQKVLLAITAIDYFQMGMHKTSCESQKIMITFWLSVNQNMKVRLVCNTSPGNRGLQGIKGIGDLFKYIQKYEAQPVNMPIGIH